MKMNHIDPEVRKLAAIAYGEASTEDNSEEIGGIAFAVANRCRAWGKSVEEIILSDPQYSYAATKRNDRYRQLMSATPEAIAKNQAMSLAINWATKALMSEGPDPSNGAYWWDGKDFKTNYEHHPKVRAGYEIVSPSHNVFNVPAELKKPVKTYWKARSKKTGKIVNTRLRGSYEYVWISTAGHGETIFWKHDPNYLQASAGKSYK